MAIDLERGAASTAIGLLGAGALVMWPTQWWIGAALMTVGALVLLVSIKVNGREWWRRTPAHALYIESRGLPLPTKVSGDGVFTYHSLHHHTGEVSIGRGSFPYSESENPEFEWGERPPPWAQRLVVANYGVATLFNVALRVEVTLRESVKRGAGHFQSGDVWSHKILPVIIGKIDTGSAHSVVTFMRNETPHFAICEIKDAVGALHGKKAKKVALEISDMGHAFSMAPPARYEDNDEPTAK